jgi:hypothetical protein
MTVSEELAAERAAAAAWLDGRGVRLEAPARNGLCDLLIERLTRVCQTTLDAGLARARADYPVLARLFDTTVASWRRATDEFLGHVARDHAALGAAPVLERIEARRSALIVDLGGRRWVYRARSLALAAWLMELTRALNRVLPLDLHVRPVLVRPGCSWDGFVPAAPCPADAVGRYFQRAGMLLGLLERLAASDCHALNVCSRPGRGAARSARAFSGCGPSARPAWRRPTPAGSTPAGASCCRFRRCAGPVGASRTASSPRSSPPPSRRRSAITQTRCAPASTPSTRRWPRCPSSTRSLAGRVGCRSAGCARRARSIAAC